MLSVRSIIIITSQFLDELNLALLRRIKVATDSIVAMNYKA